MKHIETMKLALEALENSWTEPGNKQYEFEKEAITALREALAKPDFWEGYVPEPVKPAQQGPVFSYTPDMDAVRRDEKEKADKFLAQLAQQALDRMAENARELGLDYEPVCNKDPQGCWSVRCQLGKKCKNTPAQQEPVAYIHRQGNHYEVSERFLSDDEKSRGWTEEPLYTSPPAQRTWVGLTDEDDIDWEEGGNLRDLVKAIEAKLKEKNT